MVLKASDGSGEDGGRCVIGVQQALAIEGAGSGVENAKQEMSESEGYLSWVDKQEAFTRTV